MSAMYAVPYVCPAVQVDVPGQRVPSDHDMAVAVPLAGAGVGAVTREYTTRTSRPMPDSGVREFGQWITQENWEALRGDLSTSEQLAVSSGTANTYNKLLHNPQFSTPRW